MENDSIIFRLTMPWKRFWSGSWERREVLNGNWFPLWRNMKGIAAETGRAVGILAVVSLLLAPLAIGAAGESYKNFSFQILAI